MLLKQQIIALNGGMKLAVVINKKYCKGCGICVAFCPKQVLEVDELGKVFEKNPEACISCGQCIVVCPTGAIVEPYIVDARRCISYLTIELEGAIPEELRPLMGNRIYGCDDCQLCCPWNSFASLGDPDFAVRNGLDSTSLAELFAWTEQDFNSRLAGSPIRRIGHERWLRNIAVALGNSSAEPATFSALESRRNDPSALVREHVAWAMASLHTISR